MGIYIYTHTHTNIWSTGGIILIEERVIIGGNAVPVSLGPAQIPRGLSWDLSRASVVKGRRQPPQTWHGPLQTREVVYVRLRVCIIVRQQTKRKFISSARKSVKIGYSANVTFAWSAKRKSYHLPGHLHHLALTVSPAFTHVLYIS